MSVYLISPDGVIAEYPEDKKNDMRLKGWENSSFEAFNASKAPKKEVQEVKEEPKKKKK